MLCFVWWFMEGVVGLGGVCLVGNWCGNDDGGL